ncbi:MAG: trypsin-like serine peptidase, partial [Beijerinckiaceae bacterium]
LIVIHHPLGRPKMMSRFRCFGVRNQPQDANFRHRCDTLGGSSGSLLFTTGGEVVALHKEGGLDPKDPSSFNTATRFSALLQSSDALRARAAGGRPPAAAAPGGAPQPSAAQRSGEGARRDKEDLDASDMNDALKGK